MIALRLLSIVAWAQGILAFPWGSLLQARQAGNVSEHQEEYYYSFWSEGGGTFRCTNDAGGKYTATWGGSGGFVCGKGWNPGGPRLVYLIPRGYLFVVVVVNTEACYKEENKQRTKKIEYEYNTDR